MWIEPFMWLKEELYQLACRGTEVAHAVALYGNDAEAFLVKEIQPGLLDSSKLAREASVN